MMDAVKQREGEQKMVKFTANDLVDEVTETLTHKTGRTYNGTCRWTTKVETFLLRRADCYVTL